MEMVYGASIVAAFIAGIAALFAPCCITVLFPSYFASVFKERYKVFLMTFIFFLGVLTVFLPIGLGASAVAQLFSRYHNFIFSIGGIVLLLLGFMMLFGKSLELPFSINLPEAKKYDVVSIYILGIFSAMATTCCAPVLAGVLALSAASGTMLWGGIYTLAYVMGMVLPLFLIAAFLDKINFTQKFMAIRKPIELNVGFKWQFTIAELTSGLIFLLMGIYITFLAFNNKLTAHSNYQTAINIFMARLTYHIGHYTGYIPDWGWAIIIVGIFISLVWVAIKQFQKNNGDN